MQKTKTEALIITHKLFTGPPDDLVTYLREYKKCNITYITHDFGSRKSRISSLFYYKEK